MKVFLSYTRNKDQFLKVSAFRKRLEAEIGIRVPGSQVFQDKHHFQEGDHFPEVLASELRQSDVLLVLLSPAWLQSEWCRREFALFTDDSANTNRLHQILPVLWVDTPEMTAGSVDPVARVLASINYADWRDLRYGSWDDPANQMQVGKLAERAVSLASPVVPSIVPRAPDRLPAAKEKLLLALNESSDGLPEDTLAALVGLSGARASVYLHELEQARLTRRRLRVGQRVNHWLISTPGQSYLVSNDLVA